MAQIFHRRFNAIAKATIFGGILVPLGGLFLYSLYVRSPYSTRVDVARDQPVPFSHEHHVKGLGIDCRYCHTSVETSAFAGMPTSKTCMNCHSQIWADSPMLEPVRRSFREGKPIAWTRVHDLPDFVYFDHSVHVAKGVACATCHGRVDEMPLMRREATLHMKWCLDCHRDPAKFVRPREAVFAMDWHPPVGGLSGEQLVRRHGIMKMTDCSVCHR